MKYPIEKYRGPVKALGYSDEQADDLIHSLSAIMSAFIDAAWGVHPAQLGQQNDNMDELPRRQRYGRIKAEPHKSDEEDAASSDAER